MSKTKENDKKVYICICGNRYTGFNIYGQCGFCIAATINPNDLFKIKH